MEEGKAGDEGKETKRSGEVLLRSDAEDWKLDRDYSDERLHNVRCTTHSELARTRRKEKERKKEGPDRSRRRQPVMNQKPTTPLPYWQPKLT